MEMKDVLQLDRWLRSGASLSEVEDAQRYGLVDNERFTEQARRAYKLLWLWSAPRFGGAAAVRHERFYNKCGKVMYHSRILRARRRLAGFLAGEGELA